jgi:hypothetical protein
LARDARLPFRIECFVLDMIPTKPNAEPQPSAAQNVNLSRLLGESVILSPVQANATGTVSRGTLLQSLIVSFLRLSDFETESVLK